MPLSRRPVEGLPKRLPLSQIELGHVFRASATFDERLLDDFARLSGDSGAMHTSREAAERLGYPDRLVYGFLVSLPVSRLVGNEMQDAVIASLSIDFIKPVFCGDTVGVTACVVQTQLAVRAIVLKLEYMCREQIVARGKMTVVFFAESAPPPDTEHAD